MVDIRPYQREMAALADLQSRILNNLTPVQSHAVAVPHAVAVQRGDADAVWRERETIQNERNAERAEYWRKRLPFVTALKGEQ